jgi:hypothetical protein
VSSSGAAWARVRAASGAGQSARHRGGSRRARWGRAGLARRGKAARAVVLASRAGVATRAAKAATGERATERESGVRERREGERERDEGEREDRGEREE